MATIKDVAKLAGVSFKTVSRVINNEPTVGEALQKKVWEAIKALDYQPNASARQMRGRLSSIGFIYDNPNSHYVIDLQHGILEECRKHGYELVIHPCDSTKKNIVDEILSMVRLAGLAGFVLTPPLSEKAKVIEQLVAHDLKFVRILSGRSAPDSETPCVYIDDYSAALEITQHLVDLGHKKIAFLAGEPAHKSSGERLKGYKQALKNNGIKPDPKWIIKGEYSFESGVERTKQLLTVRDKPTAVFACNDEIAAGTLFAARVLGVDVPSDLSIVGFEDSPFSRQAWPKLTTARQDNKTIARTATALLIDSVEPHKRLRDKLRLDSGFHPQLVIRESTAPPRKA